MSFKKTMLSNCLKEYRKEMRMNKTRVEKKARLIQFLEQETGLSLIDDEWDLRSNDTYVVKLSDLHGIKQVVGDFDPSFGKEMCQDFSETGEIWVTCFVAGGLYRGWKFQYRHLLSEDDTCKVEDVYNPVRSYGGESIPTLICKTD